MIDAAVELLQSGGEAALTLRETARRAGVSAMAPYRHFADKAALLTAVRNHGYGLLMQALIEADAAPSPRQALADQGVAYVAFAVENPALFRLMLANAPDKPLQPPSDLGPPQSGYDLLRRRVAVLVAPPDFEAAVLSAWGFAHGLASLALDGHLPDPITRARGAADFFVRTLAQD